MTALSDPKLEKFCQVLLVNIAQGMPRSKAAAAAAKAAGYSGSAIAANARKRAALPQVKARMAELAAPAREQDEKAVAITVGAAEDKLWEIASVDLGKKAVKVPDQISAIKTLAQIRGWNAPEKTNLIGELKIERIERVIIEPKDRDSGGVPPAPGEHAV